MTVIGGSGLTLWLLSCLLCFPGWVINVAALVHSEEPSGSDFYLTVHFFNNHLVPNKLSEDNILQAGIPLRRCMKRAPEYERLVRGTLED